MDFITAPALDTFLGDEKARLTTAGLTPERYTAVIAEVNDEVGGYVGPRILTHVPPALTHHSCAIARFRLMRDKASERVQLDHDLAVKFFMAVQAGKYSLPIADDPETPENESSAGGVWFSAPPKLLGGVW